MNKAIASRLFDASVRVEAMFWLPGLAAAVPSEFKDFIEDDLADAKELAKQLPWLKTFMGHGLDADEWPAEFHRKGCNGFLINLATPVPTSFHASGHSFSWGYYQCRWVYFESMNDVPAYADTFRKEVIEKARAEQSKKPKRQKAQA